MPLTTTVIGAWPKPDYLKLGDWFHTGPDEVLKKGQDTFTPIGNDDFNNFFDENEEILNKALDEIVAKQLDLGIDIVNDGELPRETYFLHFVRQIKGMNADNLVDKTIRNGACKLKAVSITSKLEAREEWAFKEFQQTVNSVKKWLEANKKADEVIENLDEVARSRVKYTLPGPMTILDCTKDEFYGEDNVRDLIDDLIKIINREILSLAKHGCKNIQLDEPVLMRYPEKALDYGVKDVIKCFEGLPDDVISQVHLCCGYPTYCDQDDYMKADKNLYKTLAPLLDNSGINQFSIEDAEAENNLAELLPLFKKSTVIFGAITIARSKIEEFDVLKARIGEALKYIDPERLVLAPDCGLGFLDESKILAKLEVMTKVAKEF